MKRRGLLVAGLTAVLVGCGSASKSESESAPQRPETSRASEAQAEQRIERAYEFCIEKITEQLRAPATARFSERDDGREGADGDRRFLFTGTVDSENGFGALLRSEWACDIRWSPSAGFAAESAIVAEG
jgi:hypothetical protein